MDMFRLIYITTLSVVAVLCCIQYIRFAESMKRDITILHYYRLFKRVCILLGVAIPGMWLTIYAVEVFPTMEIPIIQIGYGYILTGAMGFMLTPLHEEEEGPDGEILCTTSEFITWKLCLFGIIRMFCYPTICLILCFLINILIETYIGE